ncbi:uncharacterized protein DFL_001106 [Arthrobotrys flagrans]|uniref:Reverse transcriptase RNase H-like domain-containing protein n=1 Tax=Arthrobotrys flagrans TaxID=97331 RepID=A0A437AG98_ARTFL|nr:hypothetical protein DFL_001106 [Arthrobotrys flagrans]
MFDGKKYPIRYESGVWSSVEQKYDAVKRECRELLKALKKLRFWLYGISFTVETDANTLVAQLNMPSTDLSGALVTRWLAWIWLFDFEVKHVPGKKHTAADGLSRRPATQEEIAEADNEEDIDDFIDAQLNNISLEINDIRILEDYADEWADVYIFLRTMRVLVGMP